MIVDDRAQNAVDFPFEELPTTEISTAVETKLLDALNWQQSSTAHQGQCCVFLIHCTRNIASLVKRRTKIEGVNSAEIRTVNN